MNKKSGVLLLLVILLVMHLPFMNADPDSNISWSRGPFTDEGLYSEQIRNYINHGTFNLFESDQFFKSPLFSLILFSPLTFLGTHLWVARLTVLFMVLMLFYILRLQIKVNYLLPVLLICGLMQYYIFHHSHFALPEMIASMLILVAVVTTSRISESKTNRDKYWIVFQGITLITFAWAVKIQFIYLTLLVPFACVWFWFIQKNKSGKQQFHPLIFALFISLLYMMIYFIVWYYPHLDFVEIVKKNQSGTFSLSLDTPSIIEGNLRKYFFAKELFAFSVFTIVAFITGWIIWFKTKVNWYRSLFVVTVIWMVFEFHKLTMSYLPSRYLVSTLLSMALLIGVVATFQLNYWKRWSLVIPLVTIIILFAFNIHDYIRSYQDRTYVIAEVNQYLSGRNFGSRPVIGPWAGTCNWESKAITFPVWKDGYNDSDPINSFNPAVVISEHDEEDSGFAYKQQGINLNAVSDSVKQFEISQWTIRLYWIKSRSNEQGESSDPNDQLKLN